MSNSGYSRKPITEMDDGELESFIAELTRNGPATEGARYALQQEAEAQLQARREVGVSVSPESVSYRV